MKYLKTINENLNKRYIFKGTTIDITYCDMPKTTKQIIMEKEKRFRQPMRLLMVWPVA